MLPIGLLSHGFYFSFYSEVPRSRVGNGLVMPHWTCSEISWIQGSRARHPEMWDRAGHPGMWDKPCSPQKHLGVLGTKLCPMELSSPPITSFQRHQRLAFSFDEWVCRLQALHPQMRTTGHTSCHTALAPLCKPPLKVTTHQLFNYPLNTYFRKYSPEKWSNWLKVT